MKPPTPKQLEAILTEADRLMREDKLMDLLAHLDKHQMEMRYLYSFGDESHKKWWRSLSNEDQHNLSFKHYKKPVHLVNHEEIKTIFNRELYTRHGKNRT